MKTNITFSCDVEIAIAAREKWGNGRQLSHVLEDFLRLSLEINDNFSEGVKKLKKLEEENKEKKTLIEVLRSKLEKEARAKIEAEAKRAEAEKGWIG